jgi:hypothetical protein
VSSYGGPRGLRTTVGLLALLLVVTLVAWGVLVYAAIDFGAEARSGDSTAWTFVVLSAVGAAACLFVTLLVGARIVSLVKVGAEPARPRGGRRRAAR